MADINVACNSANGVQLNTKDTICKDNIIVKPRAASGLTPSISGSGTVTVDSSYNVKATLSGSVTASTSGWFSSGSVASFTPTVGKITQSSLSAATTTLTGTPAKTLEPGTQTTVGAGYATGARIIRARALNLYDETVSPTTTKQTITATDDYDGLGTVIVNAIPTETRSITAGTAAKTLTATSGKYITSATIQPTPSATGSGTPTASAQTINPASGQYFNKFIINATPSAGTFTHTIAPVSSTQNLTLTESNGVYTATAPMTATAKPASAGWIATSGTSASKTVSVGRVAKSTISLPRATTAADSAAVISGGQEVVIAAGYCPQSRIVRATGSGEKFYKIPKTRYSFSLNTGGSDDLILKTSDNAARLAAEAIAETTGTDDIVSASFIHITNSTVWSSDGTPMYYIGYYGYSESGGEIFFSSDTDIEGGAITETILYWSSESGSETSYTWGDTSYISTIAFSASNLTEDEYQLIAALYGS